VPDAPVVFGQKDSQTAQAAPTDEGRAFFGGTWKFEGPALSFYRERAELVIYLSKYLIFIRFAIRVLR
jgi:hypothetical protein